MFIRLLAEKLQPQTIFRIEGLRPDQKVVALTIDDAPSKDTGKILDILESRKGQSRLTSIVFSEAVET